VSENGKKRKRNTDEAAKPNKAAAVEGEDGNTKQPTRSNHPSLYEPWRLLPAKERKAVEAGGIERVVPVVYSKNQNVKSGITKLRRYLGAETEDTEDTPAALKDEEGIITVSAQGEGTVKLVGIVDMVKRITGEKSSRVAGEKGQEEGTKWYTYPVLSSVVVPRKIGAANTANAGEQQKDAEANADGDAMDIDGDDQAVKDTQEQRKDEGATKVVPVLTIWMTRKRLPAFRDAFGEQEFTVHKVTA
jgi:hypothetical protein